MLSPSSHDQQRRGSRSSNFYLGNQSKKGTDYSNALYKTELCRSFSEMGICRYGLKCRFAHGGEDLRPVTRHKKYKTEPCKNYSRDGICPYGSRCRFVHEDDVTDIMARAAISSPSPSTPPTENLFDFGGRFGASDFSDLKQQKISKENPTSLSEHFSSLLDGDGRSAWLDKLEKEEENEQNSQLNNFYRKAMISERSGSSEKEPTSLPNGWNSSVNNGSWKQGLEKLSSQVTTTTQQETTDLLLLGTSSTTRVFGNGKILPSHFHHYEDSSWQALEQQHQRRQSFSSISSIPNPTESRATPPVNSIASTTLASTPLSTLSPISRSVFQTAPRTSVIGFATPGSVSTSMSSSFTPASNNKKSVVLEALEPEGELNTPADKADLPLPQLPAFFGTNSPPSTSPTRPDPTLTFEEEATSSKKSTVTVSSLSLSLSMVRTSITTNVVNTPQQQPATAPSSSPTTTTTTTTSTTTSNHSSLSTTTRSVGGNNLAPSTRISGVPSHRQSFDMAELDDDIQIFSLPRRRTQSMSMSLNNNSNSLFSGFETTRSKPQPIPKVEPLSTVLREKASATTPDSPVGETLTIPNKRLPFFANLAISPKPDVPTAHTSS